MNEHPGYYDYLLNNYPKEISLLSEKQINLDITRAFPEDPFFHNPNIITKLKNILLCYSKRNLSIGYVQGFNFIVGRLLKFIPNNDVSNDTNIENNDTEIINNNDDDNKAIKQENTIKHVEENN